MFQTTHIQQRVISQLFEFSDTAPEIIFEWKDKESDAVGYLVINSLRGEASGGGTRIHENVSIEEITALAKTMEIKFALSGPSIGGAKSGIKMNPNHPQKYLILERWYKAIRPFLSQNYGTGSDLNTDIHKINDVLSNLGIRHSQEAIIKNMHQSDQNRMKNGFQAMQLLQSEMELKNGIKIKFSELVTGFGVAESIQAYFKSANQTLKGKTVFIQGAGNVGASTAYFLEKQGAKILAIQDKDAGIVREGGLSEEEILNILEKRAVYQVIKGTLSNEDFLEVIRKKAVDIFVPAAASHVVCQYLVKEMIKNGLQLVACGANNPFKETSYCYGDCSRYIDQEIVLLPDFLANMGMARAFYKLGSAKTPLLSFQDVMNDISTQINQYVSRAYHAYAGKLMTAALYEIAFEKLGGEPHYESQNKVVH